MSTEKHLTIYGEVRNRKAFDMSLTRITNIPRKLAQLKAYKVQLQTLGYIYDQGMKDEAQVTHTINKWVNFAGKVISTRQTKRKIAYDRCVLYCYKNQWSTLERYMNEAIRLLGKGRHHSNNEYVACMIKIIKRG